MELNLQNIEWKKLLNTNLCIPQNHSICLDSDLEELFNKSDINYEIQDSIDYCWDEDYNLVNKDGKPIQEEDFLGNIILKQGKYLYKAILYAAYNGFCLDETIDFSTLELIM